MTQTIPAQAKKPYTPPVLQTFGDIRAITCKAGATGQLDGGGGKGKTNTAP
jgi:hypothetical protein